MADSGSGGQLFEYVQKLSPKVYIQAPGGGIYLLSDNPGFPFDSGEERFPLFGLPCVLTPFWNLIDFLL